MFENSKIKSISKKKKKMCKQLISLCFLAILSNVLVIDLMGSLRGSQLVGASWIGALPTAAEVYGDASSDSPSAEAFDDDDEDEELDASATNEYPDNENDNDENYEDGDDNAAESGISEHWLKPLPGLNHRHPIPIVRNRRHAFWADLEGADFPPRSKRDIEDRIILASRRQAARSKKAEPASDDQDYAVNDDDVDAWVHDGIDDIHIDPETKKAASELSYDEKSIDAEYEPKEQLVNRTRVTTIEEVIPTNLNQDGGSGGDNEQGSQLVRHYLPASQLSLDQLQRLMDSKSPAIKTSRQPPSEEDGDF